MTDGAPDWLLPYRLERPDDAGRRALTPIGVLDGDGAASVDQRGLVIPRAGGWSLDWWVGGDDRWHLPSREINVRQRLIDAAPVVETTMRIPTGDGVHRAWAIRAASADGGGIHLVVEVENRSRAPFALALAVRPFDPDGPVPVTRIESDEHAVRVDGSVAAWFLRPPARAAASTNGDGDVLHPVMAGAAASGPVAVHDPAGRATAAFLFPVAHTATVQVVLPLDSAGERFPSVIPGAAQVAAGWEAQTRRATRFELPDPRLAEAVDACRRFLLATGDTGDGSRWPALDRHGLHAEVAAELTAAADGAGARWLAGAAEHWRLTRDHAWAAAMVDAIAAGVLRIGRAGTSVGIDCDDLLALADLLEAIDEPRAAADLRRAASLVPSTKNGRPDPDELDRLLATASPTWTWAEGSAAGARLCDLVRARLVSDDGSSVALCPHPPAGWQGQPIEVHRAPTAWGPVSFAVRWHGDRPALLWELDTHPDRTPPTITAPGLDATWRTTERSGEALLAG